MVGIYDQVINGSRKAVSIMNMNEEKNIKVPIVNEAALQQVVGGAGGSTGECVIVNCDYVNVRDKPKDGKVIGKLKCGTVVNVIGKDGFFGHIIYNGVDAYIFEDYYKKI